MKKRILAMVLAVLMIVGIVPVAVMPAFAEEQAQAASHRYPEDIYVSDGLLFRWDAADLVSGSDPLTVLTNKVDGTTISAGTNTVGDGYLLGKSALNLSKYMPTQTFDGQTVLDDMTFELVIAQNRELAGATTWSSSGTQSIGALKSFQMQTNYANKIDGNGMVQGTYMAVYNKEPNTIAYPYSSNTELWTELGYTNSNAGTVNRNHQFATDSSWAKTRFLGAEFGKIFSIAYVMAYEFENPTLLAGTTSGLALGDATVSLYRDTVITAQSATFLYYPSSVTTDIKFGHGSGFEYYAIRLYNRTLTSSEMQQNHLADLATYANADVAGVDTLYPEQIYSIAAQFADVNLADALTVKADIEQAIATAVTEKAAIEAAQAREAIYVQKDLVYLANGTSGLIPAGLSGVTPEDGYYANNGSNVTITGLADLIAGKSATYEIVYGYEAVAATKTVTSSRDGSSWEIGPTKINGNTSPEYVAGGGRQSNTDLYAGMSDVVLNVKSATKPGGVWFADLAYNVAQLTTFGGETGTVNSVFYIRELYDHESYTEGKSFKLTIGNGTNTVVDGNTGNGTHIPAPMEYVESHDSTFKIGSNLNMMIYGIRVYAKALTEDERLQNHFADLVNVSSADVTGFADLLDEQKAELYAAYAGVAIENADAAQIEEDIATAIQEKAEAELIAARKALYVPGASFQWDAFDVVAGDTLTGVFANDNGDDATYTASKATAGDGYILLKDNINLSAFLPTTTVNETTTLADFTFEALIAQNSELIGTEYAAANGSYYIGPVRSTMGGLASTGANAATKGFVNNIYKRLYKAEPNKYIDPNNTEITASTNQVQVAVDEDWTGRTILSAPLGQQYYFAQITDYEYENPTTVSETGLGDVTIKLIRDGGLVNKNTYSDTAIAYAADQVKELRFGNATHGFEFYAIRIYAEALTANQLMQNHFADLVNYFAADITGWDKLYDDQKEALYVAYAAATFDTTDADTIEADVAAAVAEVEIAEMRENYNKLYVQDGLVYLANGFTSVAGSALPVGISGVTAEDGYFANNGAWVNVANLADLIADKDATYEVIFGYEDEAATQTLNNRRMHVATFGALKISGSVSPVFAEKQGALPWGSTDETKRKDLYAGASDLVLNYQDLKNDTGAAVNNWFTDLDPTKELLATKNGGNINAFTYKRVLYDHESYTEGKSVMVTLMNGETTIVNSSKASGSAAAPIEYLPSFDSQFSFGNSLNTRIYGIRVYAKDLSADERAQNHFVDLAAYAGVDVAPVLDLYPAVAQPLYNQFKTVSVELADLEAIESAIASAVADNNDLAAILAGEAANVLTFDGYQVRIADFAGLRSRYTVNLDYASDNGYELVEVGAIMAIAGNRDITDLTVAKGEYGYEVTINQAASQIVYDGSDWTNVFTGEDGNMHFAYTTTFDGTYTAEQYKTELLYRGYVVLTDGTDEFVVYADMLTGATAFTDGRVSMYEISKLDANKDYETSQAVLAACGE